MRCCRSLLQMVWMSMVLGAARAQNNVGQTEDGLRIKFDQAQIKLSAVSPDAFCLSVTSNGAPKISSSFLAVNTNSTAPVECRVVEKEGLVGVQTVAGELLMNPQNGAWTLQNADGETLIPLHAIGDLAEKTSGINSQITLALGWDTNKPIGVYGCGNGSAALLQTKTKTGVSNGKAVIPYYWSDSGYAVLAVTANDDKPASWSATTNHDAVMWIFPGPSADLYLMPAASLKKAVSAYADLTGHAPVPPRWAFGYLQSRWGWTNRPYIEDTLKKFQDLKLPVDAFIYDFEWFTAKPDYEVPPQGIPGYSDFGWNTNLFPEPAKQIHDYKKQGVHFVGIRKPRLGDSDSLAMMRSNGWDLRNQQNGFEARDIDFHNSELSDWYVGQSSNLFSAGVDGWWNDEGEASFTTYYYWNLTEAKAMALYHLNHRLWTLNRAFSPGTQRLGAAAWTGDINASWKDLAETPANLLNWSVAGMPYDACDIGGFHHNTSPELLTRWMEAGVFFPIMRSHSEISVTPHFPWLYGTNALNAIRSALDLRYRLIPFYYSLAHETFETGVPPMRPLVMEFPSDSAVVNMSDEWMMGDSLLAAPLLQTNDTRSIYFPTGDWYVFGTNHLVAGNQTMQVSAGLDEIPAYIRAGSILPLAPVIQHTSELPGGPLELQIYPGKDATFTLVEDDGETLDYQKQKIRRTTFVWNDAAGTLTWKRVGDYDSKDVFKKMRAVLFDPKGIVRAKHNLSAQGSLVLRASK
ncbi:MAG TPA: TIM-barrel domain-containing protein [Dongiaceae bacterium]|jgi:alpha-glucosidase|nr:TIM-barrel domain-containing protein [Dongiaceae bacterium]